MTVRRAARRELLASGDILPRELMPAAYPDLFSTFRIQAAGGRLGIDFALHRRQTAAEADLKRRFEAFFADRGISTKYVDRDERFEEVLAASRERWGLNHQGVASKK